MTLWKTHLLTPASLPVCDWFVVVPEVALLAVVAVSARRVVAASQAHSAGHPTAQLVELHVEPTGAGVQVTLAGWKEK